jgi:myo-inositol-1-phosphate synthase
VEPIFKAINLLDLLEEKRMSSFMFHSGDIRVESPNVTYGEGEIRSKYVYEESLFENGVVTPIREEFEFKVSTEIPKTGLLLVGIGGNNGSTVTASLIAHKNNITWHTK